MSAKVIASRSFMGGEKKDKEYFVCDILVDGVGVATGVFTDHLIPVGSEIELFPRIYNYKLSCGVREKIGK